MRPLASTPMPTTSEWEGSSLLLTEEDFNNHEEEGEAKRLASALRSALSRSSMYIEVTSDGMRSKSGAWNYRRWEVSMSAGVVRTSSSSGHGWWEYDIPEWAFPRLRARMAQVSSWHLCYDAMPKREDGTFAVPTIGQVTVAEDNHGYLDFTHLETGEVWV